MYTFVVVTPRHSISERDSVVKVVEKAPIAKAVCFRLNMWKMKNLDNLEIVVIPGFQAVPSRSLELGPGGWFHFARMWSSFPP